MNVVFITGNAHKAHEASTLMAPLGISVEQRDLGYPELQADTLEDVARFGIDWCMEKLKKPCFLEDAGLFIEALNGFPGPYSKYVFETIGNEGVMNLLSGSEKRRAVFRSVIAYHDGMAAHLFVGETWGEISPEPRGDRGFGYDPIFIPDGHARTFAEMGTERKNALSHRGKSLNKLINYFKEHT
jgi:XTP/dITP diphosphohydrolase